MASVAASSDTLPSDATGGVVAGVELASCCGHARATNFYRACFIVRAFKLITERPSLPPVTLACYA